MVKGPHTCQYNTFALLTNVYKTAELWVYQVQSYKYCHKQCRQRGISTLGAGGARTDQKSQWNSALHGY